MRSTLVANSLVSSLSLSLSLSLSGLVGLGGCGSSSGDDDTPGDGGIVDAPGAPIPDASPDAAPLPNFSFFVTSLDTMRLQSGSQDGFGGNLGGLAGADAICQTAAANVGFGAKTWRAFLSVTNDPATGGPVHAIDRIGAGPWYDRNGRLIANDIAGLLHTRPEGDPQTINDLPDENGQPGTLMGDTHDIMTGSNNMGRLENSDPVTTCFDWTSVDGFATEEAVACGHSWPAMSGQSWMRAHHMRGCAAGVNLVQNGPGTGYCVGCGGGWGGIYCFALTP